jgi:hypothetical protein
MRQDNKGKAHFLRRSIVLVLRFLGSSLQLNIKKFDAAIKFVQGPNFSESFGVKVDCGSN